MFISIFNFIGVSLSILFLVWSSILFSEPTGCVATDGATAGQACVFPFIFGNNTYNECIIFSDPEQIPWCSTKVAISERKTLLKNNSIHLNLTKSMVYRQRYLKIKLYWKNKNTNEVHIDKIQIISIQNLAQHLARSFQTWRSPQIIECLVVEIA